MKQLRQQQTFKTKQKWNIFLPLVFATLFLMGETICEPRDEGWDVGRDPVDGLDIILLPGDILLSSL